MRILHGMLESDPLETEEEFVKAFLCLRDSCGVSWQELQIVLNKPPWLMQAWSEGLNVPDKKHWISISRMVMRVLEKEVGV